MHFYIGKARRIPEHVGRYSTVFSEFLFLLHHPILKVKVKSPCLTKYHPMKAYAGVEV
jgi:hypothetical protein